jgi:hypothetical protein
MTNYLVVTKSFLQFTRGDIIADAAKVGEILASEYKKFVTKVAAPNTLKGWFTCRSYSKAASIQRL